MHSLPGMCEKLSAESVVNFDFFLFARTVVKPVVRAIARVVFGVGNSTGERAGRFMDADKSGKEYHKKSF